MTPRPYDSDALVRVEGADVDALLALRTIHDVIDLRHESESAAGTLRPPPVFGRRGISSAGKRARLIGGSRGPCTTWARA